MHCILFLAYSILCTQYSAQGLSAGGAHPTTAETLRMLCHMMSYDIVLHDMMT